MSEKNIETIEKTKLGLKKLINKINMIDIIFFIAPFFVGMYSLFANYLLVTIVMLVLIYRIKQNKKLFLPKGKNAIMIILYLISYLFVSIWAIDKGMAIMGFFKNLSIAALILLLIQEEKIDRRRIYNEITLSATLTVIVSLMGSIFFDNVFFFSGRLQGTFLYANSYGLFLLVALCFNLLKDKMRWYDYITSFICIIGIILTNSRAILILTVISALTMLLCNKKNAKGIFITIVTGILVQVVVIFLLNINSRLNNELLSSGEFITRLLYYKDAVTMIKDNPFGYGYLGWSYEQLKIQTGVYDTMFVHNSILQLILDVGILPTIIIGLLFIFILLDKKVKIGEKMIMLIILGHSLIDFDMEFMYFIFIILTFVNFETFVINLYDEEDKKAKNKNFQKNKTLKLNDIKNVFICIAVIFFILFVSSSAYSLHEYTLSRLLVPFHTKALEQELYEVDTAKRQYDLAIKIEKLNKNISGVWEAKSNFAIANNDYKKALIYEKKLLSLNKYTMQNYLEYTSFLEKAMNYYYNKGDYKQTKFFMEEIINVESIIEDVIAKTNPLCYKTQHKPRLDIPEILSKFISQIKETYDKF